MCYLMGAFVCIYICIFVLLFFSREDRRVLFEGKPCDIY